MRLTRIGWSMVLAVVVFTALLSIAYLHRAANEYVLPDGSLLRFEKIYYGKPESYDYDGWVGRLKKRVPKKLIDYFTRPAKSIPRGGVGKSSWYTLGSKNTNNDALYLYVTRRAPSTGKLENVGFRSAWIEDQHGCILSCTQAGGEDDGRLAAVSPNPGTISSVTWFRFEAFPRDQRKLHLLLFESTLGPYLAGLSPKPREFVIDNPAFGNAQKNDRVPQQLPVSSTNQNVTFMLTGMSIHSVTNRKPYFQFASYYIDPAFSCMEDGHVSSNWRALDMELYDGSGNFSGMGWTEEPPFLCPHEAFWKLRAKFFGSEQSRGASNVNWTLHGIEIPAAGEYTSLHDSRTIDGETVEAWFFAGPGEFQYSPSKKIIERASVLNSSDENNNERVRIGDTLRSKSPHLTFKFSPLPDNQRLTVRATDEQGRYFYGYEPPSRFRMTDSNPVPHEVLYLHKTYGKVGLVISVFFDLPLDAKKIDLTFCVHTCRTVDFVFKPPAELASSITNTFK